MNFLERNAHWISDRMERGALDLGMGKLSYKVAMDKSSFITETDR